MKNLAKRYEWWILAILAAIITVMGTIGFHRTPSGSGDITKSLYLAIQLFFLESGTNEPNIPFFSLLNAARWLAPLLLAYAGIKTAITILADEWHLMKLIGLKKHIIFFGYNDALVPLIKNLIETKYSGKSQKQKSKIIIVTDHASNTQIASLRKSGVIFVKRAPSESQIYKRIKVKKAKYCFIVTSNDFSNVMITKELLRYKQTFTKSEHLIAYALISHPSLKIELQHHEVFIRNYKNFDARVFNPHENTARLLYKKYAPDIFKPVTTTQAPSPNILLLGFNDTAQAFLTQHGLLGHYINETKPAVTVMDDNTSEIFAQYIARTHHIKEILDLEFIHKNLQCLAKQELNDVLQEKHFDVIYLFIDNETLLFSLTSWLHLLHATHSFYVIINCYSNFIANKQMQELPNNFILANLAEESASPLYIIDEELDWMAKQLHALFLETENKKHGGPGKSSKPSAVPWNILPEEYKQSNRSQADHLLVKLRSAEVVSPRQSLADAKKALNDKPDWITKKQLEQLAITEHNRWCAEKWIIGWEQGERDDDHKRHPDLVPWEDLNEGTKDYDRVFVKSIPELLKNL